MKTSSATFICQPVPTQGKILDYKYLLPVKIATIKMEGGIRQKQWVKPNITLVTKKITT